MLTTLITGLIGMAMVTAFVGFMISWVPAPPLIAINAFVGALMIYDFVKTVRSGESGV